MPCGKQLSRVSHLVLVTFALVTGRGDVACAMLVVAATRHEWGRDADAGCLFFISLLKN